MLSDLLLKILKWDPKERPSAREMLKHPWFSMPDNYNYKMNEMEFKLYELKDQTNQIDAHCTDYNALIEEQAILINFQN